MSLFSSCCRSTITAKSVDQIHSNSYNIVQHMFVYSNNNIQGNTQQKPQLKSTPLLDESNTKNKTRRFVAHPRGVTFDENSFLQLSGKPSVGSRKCIDGHPVAG